MLRDIYIQPFNKLFTSYRPETFNTLTLTATLPHPTAHKFQITNQEGISFKLYLSPTPLEPLIDDIVYLMKSHKILVLKSSEAVIEEGSNETLSDYLLRREEEGMRVDETEAQRIMRSVIESQWEYELNKMAYQCVHHCNIVRSRRRADDWQVSLVGYVLQHKKMNEQYYGRGDSAVLGVLLFKILFGFVPKCKQFRINTFLESCTDMLQIYQFACRLIDLSPQCRQLLESALQGSLPLKDFLSHPFFSSHVPPPPPLTHQRLIQVISYFSDKSLRQFQSAVMAAIEWKEKYPKEFINRINQPAITALHPQNHPILSLMNVSKEFAEQSMEVMGPIKSLNLPYFNAEAFDPATDSPCKDLLQLLQESKSKEELMMYAYPYAMVFELHKVMEGQTANIQSLIHTTCEYLLQISCLHYQSSFPVLHRTPKTVESFSSIKGLFRRNLNTLYQHFLSEAVGRYNAAKYNTAQTRAVGLEYYRLCLKLLEASLVVRKKGKDIDLPRIETAQAKQIEEDIDRLLKTYFPKNVSFD